MRRPSGSAEESAEQWFAQGTSRPRRSLPPLASFYASAQRIRVATAVLALISELNLALAHFVPVGVSMAGSAFVISSSFHMSFDGVVGLLYFVFLHIGMRC